jgi:hypothetical protein
LGRSGVRVCRDAPDCPLDAPAQNLRPRVAVEGENLFPHLPIKASP